MAVTFTGVLCKCGHSQLIHFMSTDDCPTRTNVFEKDVEIRLSTTPIRVDRCPCKKYVPAA